MKNMMLLAGMLFLVGCAEQQDAYEFAQSHVWGDKVNGCDYQTIKFYPNYIEYTRSEKMIKNLSKFVEKDGMGNLSKEKIEKHDVKLLTKNNKYFILSYKYGHHSGSSQYSRRFDRHNDELYLAGFYNGEWKYYERNNDIYPTDYVVCE